MTNLSRSATVYYNDRPIGILKKEDKTYRFKYNEAYISDASNRPVSVTLPLRREAYVSDTLFPVFINMLSEGSNKHIQCRMMKIDEHDYFGLLLATAKEESIGPITIKEIDEFA